MINKLKKLSLIAFSSVGLILPISSCATINTSSKEDEKEKPIEVKTQKLTYADVPAKVDMNSVATPATAKNNSATNIELSLKVTNLDANVKIQYNHGDGTSWKGWKDLTDTTAVTLCPNEVVQLRGYCPTTGTLNKENGDGLNILFTSTLSNGIMLGGNIMSLLCDKADYSTCLESVSRAYCFNGLFKDSTALTSIPANFLPSISTTEGCYQSLFENCTNLNRAPALISTSMSKYAYKNMFKGCSSLVVAPSLPAIELADGCYEGIFEGCSRLTSISLSYFGNIVDKYFLNWINNVSSEGKIYYNGADNNLTGLVPTNFSVVKDPSFKTSTYFKNNLKEMEFKADKDTARLQGGVESIKVICDKNKTIESLITTNQLVPSKAPGVPEQHKIAYANSSNSGLDTTKALSTWPSKVTIKYGFVPVVNSSYINLYSSSDFKIEFASVATDCTLSYSTDEGKTWSPINTSITTKFNKDVHYLIKGNINSTSESNYTNIKIINSTDVHLSGNIMALIQKKDVTPTTITTPFAFYKLFCNSTAIKDIADDFLPSTTVTSMCYASMFEGCTKLTNAPALKATQLAGGCYYRMFADCTQLTKTSTMPAAVTFADPYTTGTGTTAGCCREMFNNCQSLTTVSSLPFNTMKKFGCYAMFQKCEALKTLPASIPATTVADNCYQYMFNGCTSLKTLPASFLPATTLADCCYEFMFLGCKSLTTPMTNLPASGINASAYRQMFKDCASLTRTPKFHGVERSDRNNYKNDYTNYELGKIRTCAMESMFENCTSLTTAENIANNSMKESTTGPSYDYTFRYMFKGCTSLKIAPFLTYIAAEMGKNCYQEMFANCSNLTVGWAEDSDHRSFSHGKTFFVASILLSGENNYLNMFSGCRRVDRADATPEYKTVRFKAFDYETHGNYYCRGW